MQREIIKFSACLRVLHRTIGERVLFACFLLFLVYPSPIWGQLIRSVDSVGITVADVDRSVEFFSKVLSFEKVSDNELAGPEYEGLTGVFGARIRTVRMKLGAEFIDLAESVAPRGRPIPPVSRSNYQSFQHVAIVVS